MDNEIRYCKCGCGQILTSKTANYIKGHSSRDPEIKKRVLENMRKTMLEKYGTTNVTKIDSVKEKIRQTCLQKYGVDNPSKCKEIVQKISNTIQERYGVAWATQKSDYKEKVKQTSIEKYGVEHYTKSEQVKNKIKESNLEKYGTEYYQQCQKSKDHYIELSREKYGTDYMFQSEEVKDKIKKTLNERYGVDNIMKLPETLDKLKKTNMENFGVEWTRQNKDIVNKGKETCIQKYGVDNPGKCPDIVLKGLRKLRESAWQRIISNQYWNPCFTKEYFLEHGWIDYPIAKNNTYEFECKKCHEKRFFRIYFPKCKKCNPATYRSKPEIEMYDYIKSIVPCDVEIQHSNRTILSNNRELDIYIPSKKLAFEFNGLYWHSISCHSDENYHLSKTLECEEKGIHLVHVLEDEWYNNKEVTKSRIKNLLGIYDKTIYARQCEIRLITNKSEYIDFLNNNHTQGYVGCKYAIGLYHNNELVSLMTFGSLRKSMGSNSVDNQYELLRFCNKCGYHIPGSASKLFKYFIKTYNPDKIISYADKRWSNGNLYRKIGFTLSHMSRPNYWYVDPTYMYREYRFKYRKSELPKLLENFDPNLSEQQNMLDNGFNIIYDCGNYVFQWNPIN